MVIAVVTVMIVSRLILIWLRCKLLTTLCMALTTAHVIMTTITYRFMLGPFSIGTLVVFYGCYDGYMVSGTIASMVTGNSGIRIYRRS